MAYLIPDKNFINDNIFQFEKRMESQYTRFLDKNPTFVTYFNISDKTTTTDTGLFNVEQILGVNSPLKFNKIVDFPIYGIESILLNLGDEEEGLTSSFESDAVILPNTIVPLPNDLFTISYLDKNYLFMITSVSYDFIKSHNFYKIEYMLRSVTSDQISYLDSQVDEGYTCLFRNIGTEDKCIIKSDEYDQVIQLNTLFSDLTLKYKHMFYNKKYDSFIYKNSGEIVYDSFLTNFINKHHLFNERFNFSTIMLQNQDYYENFELDYDSSIYSMIETCDRDAMPDKLLYTLKPITDVESVFTYFRVKCAKSVFFFPLVNNYDYIEEALLCNIKDNIRGDNDDILNRIIINYFNKNLKSFNNFELNEVEKIIRKIDYSFRTFIYVPIVLYIMKSYYKEFIKTNK